MAIHFPALTEAQIAAIRTAWTDKRDTRSVAREVGCSQRTVCKYFLYFSRGWEYRGRIPSPKPVPRSERKPTAEHRPPPPREDRFYKSDFTPS